MTTLQVIRDKVRRLVAEDTQQLTDADIDFYINTYYLNDFPQQLRLIKQQINYELPLFPGQGTYAVPWDSYTSFSGPAYVAGYPIFFSQSQQQFYQMFPEFQQQAYLTGDGTVGPYTTSLQFPQITPGTVYVSALSAVGNLLESTDDALGSFSNATNVVAGSFVNYATGSISITFSDIVAAGHPISIQYATGQWQRPQGLLLFDSEFQVRPVPDQSYLLVLQAYALPTVLMGDGSSPELPFWWQALAFGAAKKIFEERMDTDQINKVLPMLKEQLTYCQRTTLMENSQQRPTTPYSQQLAYQNGTNSGLTTGYWY